MEENDIIHTKRELTNLWCDMDKNKDLATLIDRTINILNDLFYQNQQYKQQIEELEKWLAEEIARLDIELGNTFGVHGIIIKEKYDLRDAYIQVLSKLKGDEK